jgi:superfamily II DNA or RNA helicase
MAASFQSVFVADGVLIRVVERRRLGKSRDLPRSEWQKSGVDRRTLLELEALAESGIAKSTDIETWISSREATAFPDAVCGSLGFPPPIPLGLTVALDGRIETSTGALRLRWSDRWGREVRPLRTGLLLQWGEQAGRLAPFLLDLVEATEVYNQTVGKAADQRIPAWLPVQNALKSVTGEDVQRDGFLETFTLYQAGSFALDVRETSAGVDFTPILMSRNKAVSLEDDAPADDVADFTASNGVEGADQSDGWTDALLNPEDQRSFIKQAVEGPGDTRDAYLIGRNRYVLINPALKRALNIVKEKRGASSEERRTFLRNPRAAIAQALENDEEDSPSARIFIETQHYSDRVEGLGLWERPQLPWLARRPNSWLPETGWITDGPASNLPVLTDAELTQIENDIQAAEIRGDAHVVIRGCPIPIDSAPQVLAEERRKSETTVLQDSPPTNQTEPVDAYGSTKRLVLLIKKTNFDGVEYELGLKQRLAFVKTDEPPVERMGTTALKLHQIEGFRWLVDAWRTGWPGVLLADDMGLGKTYQALAFLAWLKSNASKARARFNVQSTGPCLVVAPTALLKNWEKECYDRLSELGLGSRLDAYGKALRRLKLGRSSNTSEDDTLDVAQLRDADWILTTYETLTDHERSFARIPYSVVLFDEMQKVKAPDTLNTKAAKALNADFVIGLTGTPIENRMEDLWCLFDRLIPGFLGDLKTFSKTFKEDAPEKLGELKRMLDAPVQSAPPVMKRRMKADILEGLPSKEEIKYPTPMPQDQAEAYRELVQEASSNSERSRGFMLKVLHGMRGISLHPQDPSAIDASKAAQFEMFVRRSARLSTTVRLLRDIATRNEKALVFIESLAMQDVLAEGVATLLDMDRKPAVINGATPGERRLAIVDAFERSGDGFRVLVLSPKAAGVGLNIVAANHVIHLSRWWNPAVEDQCNDRVYRIGQTKRVKIHIPIATHPDFPEESFDEVLDRLLEAKRRLSRDMLAPPTSEGDIENLFGGTVKGH